MPIQTKTITIQEEIEHLEAERQELAQEAAALTTGDESDTERLGELRERGTSIDAHLDGLDAVLEPHSAANYSQVKEVTLGGLTGGEYGHVEDVLVEAAHRRNGGVGSGAMRVHMVAKGTQSASYIDGADSFEEEVMRVGQLPVGFLKWAESRIDDLTSVGGNGRRSFDALVEANTADESGETLSTTTQSQS